MSQQHVLVNCKGAIWLQQVMERSCLKNSLKTERVEQIASISELSSEIQTARALECWHNAAVKLLENVGWTAAA